MWWQSVKDGQGHIKRLVVYLDNGPKNSGIRTQWIKRMAEFADWSGLEVRLVYYPPYHSKYNPIERCWSSLEQKWGGTLLNSLKVILQEARKIVGELFATAASTGLLRMRQHAKKSQTEIKEEQLISLLADLHELFPPKIGD